MLSLATLAVCFQFTATKVAIFQSLNLSKLVMQNHKLNLWTFVVKSVLSLNSKSNFLTYHITARFQISTWLVQSIEYPVHFEYMLMVNRLI